MEVADGKESQAQLLQFLQKRKKVINQKLKRCRQFKNSQPPECYSRNTPKEQLVLEHVIQLKKQFQQHIGENRELFLFPKNECDVYKFICTTIRPTKLGFLQLYQYQECADRLSKFIQYEQLDPPDEFPKCIPSPANVAKWQKGDCFDLSILLCSLLIGVGYDAYVVFGIAPKQITSKNEALMECQLLKDLRQQRQDQNVGKQQKKQDSIFQKRIIESSYDREIFERKRMGEEELAHKALNIDDDEPDELTPDLFLGKRIHAWVLLKKGKRQVAKDMFIEPSTGKVYDTKGSPYLLVDAIFNHKNFYIHMQPKHKVDEIKFDLQGTISWDYVMLPQELYRNDDGQQQINDLEDKKLSDEEEKLKYLAQTLDMPPPWSPKIYIEKDNFLKGTPLGETTTFFIRAKVEKYAPYSQKDGLVLKYTLYEDYKKIKVKQIGYFYKHRSDKLDRRYRYPFEFKTVEYYLPYSGPDKSPPHWKQVIEIDRRLRIITYYRNRNDDFMLKRIEKIGEKTSEIYEGRDDRIKSWTINFVKVAEDQVKTPKIYTHEDKHVGKVSFTKMTQTFEKDPRLPAKQQIAKMTVDYLKQTVVIFYHMDSAEIQPIKKEYSRDQILGIGKIDTNQKKNDQLIQNEYTMLSRMQKACYTMAKENEVISADEYKKMKFGVLTIDKTLYDKARQKFKENRNKVDEEAPEDDTNDYLRPFLEKRKLAVNEPIRDSKLASEIKSQILQKMKQRMIARAKIIQERLQKQQDHLKHLEEQYQKKQEEKNQKELSQVKFKITILESRISRFESNAISKFRDLDQKLASDPRLAILKEQK